MPRRGSKHIDATNLQIGQDGVVTMANTGEALLERRDIQSVDGPQFKSLADELAFMEEPVTVLVHGSSEKNAEQIVEVGVTRRGKTVTSCVARVYGPAERDFTAALTPEESQLYALLRELCENAAGPDEGLGWVDLAAWRDAYRKFVIMHSDDEKVRQTGGQVRRLNETEKKRWQRCGTALRDKGRVMENERNQVIIVEGTSGTFAGH